MPFRIHPCEGLSSSTGRDVLVILMLRSQPWRTCLVLLFTMVIMAGQTVMSSATAEENSPSDDILLKHAPVFSAPAGEPITINAQFDGEGDISEVRLYFKTMAMDSYLYVVMERTGKSRYESELPPAKNGTKGVDYLILFTDNTGEAIRSKTYRILISDIYTSPRPGTAKLEVFSERPLSPQPLATFAAPLRVVATTSPLLASATPYKHPPIKVPGPAPGGTASSRKGLGGMSISISVGGVGISVGGH